jgi:hypothetical protein
MIPDPERLAEPLAPQKGTAISNRDCNRFSLKTDFQSGRMRRTI